MLDIRFWRRRQRRRNKKSPNARCVRVDPFRAWVEEEEEEEEYKEEEEQLRSKFLDPGS